MREEDEVKLTAQELRVAKRAAELAVEQITTQFYAGVGKSLVQRFIIWAGAAAVAYAIGKGWITFPKT